MVYQRTTLSMYGRSAPLATTWAASGPARSPPLEKCRSTAACFEKKLASAGSAGILANCGSVCQPQQISLSEDLP